MTSLGAQIVLATAEKAGRDAAEMAVLAASEGRSAADIDAAVERAWKFSLQVIGTIVVALSDEDREQFTASARAAFQCRSEEIALGNNGTALSGPPRGRN